MSYVNSASAVLLGVLFPVIAVGVSSARLVLSSRRKDRLGLEDWLSIAALFLASACGILMIIGGANNAISGTATFGTPPTPRRDDLLTRLTFALLPLTTLAFGFIRLSTLSLYQKAFTTSTFQRIHGVVISVVIVITFAFFVGYLSSCGGNVSAFFGTNDDRESTCPSSFTFLAAFGLTDVILDAILLILPIYPSWQFGFTRKELGLLVVAFALAVFGIVAGGLRTAYSFQLATSANTDPLGVLATVVWWLFIQVGTALIISNVLTFIGPLRTKAAVEPKRLDLEAARGASSRGPLETWDSNDTASIASNKEWTPRLKSTTWRNEKTEVDQQNRRRERTKSKDANSFKKNVHFSPIVSIDEAPGRFSPPMYTSPRSAPRRPAMPERAATDSSVYSAASSTYSPRLGSDSRSLVREKPKHSMRAYLYEKRQRSNTLPTPREAEQGKRLGAQYSPPNMSSAYQGRFTPPPAAPTASSHLLAPAEPAQQPSDAFLRTESQSMEQIKSHIRATYGTSRVLFSPLVVPSQGELENWPFQTTSPMKSPGLTPTSQAISPRSPGVMSILEELPTPTTPGFMSPETARTVAFQRVQLTPPRHLSEPQYAPSASADEDDATPQAPLRVINTSPSPKRTSSLHPHHQPAPSAETVHFFYDPSKDSPIYTSPSVLPPLLESSTPSLMPNSTRSSDTMPAHLHLKLAAEDTPPIPSLSDRLSTSPDAHTPLSPWPQTWTGASPTSTTTPVSRHRHTRSLDVTTPDHHPPPFYFTQAPNTSLLRQPSLHRPTRSLDDLWNLPPLAQEEAAALIPHPQPQLPPSSPPMVQTPYSATSSIFNFFRHRHDASKDTITIPRPLFSFHAHQRTASHPAPLLSPSFPAFAAPPSTTHPPTRRPSRRYSSPTSPPTPLPEHFPSPPRPRLLRFSNIPTVLVQSPSPPRPPSADFPTANLAVTAPPPHHARDPSSASAVSTPGFFCRGLPADGTPDLVAHARSPSADSLPTPPQRPVFVFPVKEDAAAMLAAPLRVSVAPVSPFDAEWSAEAWQRVRKQAGEEGWSALGIEMPGVETEGGVVV